MRKWLAFITTAVLVTGCGSKDGIRRYPAVYPNSQAEAGTTTMAVVAVERWQDIAGSLKPNFTLTGDAAAANVLLETQASATRLLNSLGAGLSVGLPSQTFTNTDKLTQAAGQAPAEEQTKTRTEQSGTAPEQKIDAITGRQASALPTADIAGATLKLDPVLQYQTAAALFQEVALLNHYVDSAALRHGYLPYLVRLQIAVTPTVAREPYNVLSHISFFARTDRRMVTKACMKEANLSRGGGLPAEKTYAAASLGEGDPAKDNLADNSNCVATRAVQVVPLVVSDDLELARQTRVADLVRQLALNLGGTLQGVALQTQLQALDDQMQSIVGRTLNSVSSVTRLNDNTPSPLRRGLRPDDRELLH